MAKQWHIDGVSALIVDGVRYTLQEFEYRGDGFVINAPFVLTGCKWGHYDTWAISGGFVDYDEATFYEGTFEHYGTAGIPERDTPPPPYSLTVLMPHTVRRTGRNLVFASLGVPALCSDYSYHRPGIELFVNGIQQYIASLGAHSGNDHGYYAVNWQGYALASVAPIG